MKPFKPNPGPVDRLVQRLIHSTGGSDRESDIRMRQQILIGMAMMAIFLVWDEVTRRVFVETHLRLFTPWSLTHLLSDDWRNLALTSISAVLTFASAVTISSIVGFAVAALRRTDRPSLTAVGLSLDAIYRFLYIVPVVLSISLIYTFALSLFLQNTESPTALLPVLIMVFSATCIAGYPIYSSIYSSAVTPDKSHLFLVDALYLKARGPRMALPKTINEIIYLNDGRISNLCENIERAWHLTIVAVVIVESIIPGVYTTVTYFGAGRGVGFSVIQAQGANGTARVMGFMWGLFFVDLTILVVVRFVLHRLFLRHYKGKALD